MAEIDDARQQISEHHLQENVAPGVGQRRRADNRQGAGFGRNDGECDGPPRRAPAAQKIIFQRVLLLAETRAEPRDPGEIDDDDGEIDGSQRDWGDCNNPGTCGDSRVFAWHSEKRGSPACETVRIALRSIRLPGERELAYSYASPTVQQHLFAAAAEVRYTPLCPLFCKVFCRGGIGKRRV